MTNTRTFCLHNTPLLSYFVMKIKTVRAISKLSELSSTNPLGGQFKIGQFIFATNLLSAT
jgi:hypothetical protein